MKLQIIENDSQKITGFETVYLNEDNRELALDHIADNSCELIIAKNTLDNSKNAQEALLKVCSKLRIGGSISISGLEMRCFFKNVINGITNEATASALVGQSLSISTIDSVKNNLRALGLVIKTSILNGITYEITAERRAAK